MPVEFHAPSLLDFVKLAAASNENSTIRSKNSGLSSTRLPTWASTNQRTMQDFVSALRTEYGSSIADAAQARLETLTESGRKPLKAFMIRETVDESIRTWQRNINTCDRFLSGIDPEHCLDATASAEADRKGIADPALRSLMKEAMREELRSAFAKPSGEVSVAAMEGRLSRSDAVHAAVTYSSPEYPFRSMPGTDADKYRILHMLDRNVNLAGAVMQHLDLCRLLQPEGRITPETVWEAVTEKPMPETVTRENFADELDAAFRGILAAKNLTPDKVDGVMSCLSQVKLEAAVEIAAGRPLTEADLIDPDSILRRVSAKGQRADLERSVARDVGRVANTNVSGEPAAAGITFGLPEGDVAVPLGKAARETFAFADEADRNAFRSGSPSSYTAALLENCRAVSGGNQLMAGTLAAFLTQTPVAILGAQGHVGALGSLVEGRLNEHMAVNYDIRPQADGTVRVTLKSNEDAQTAGRGMIEATIRPDGSIAMDRLSLESPENVRQAAFRERMNARFDADETIPAAEKPMLRSIVTEGLTEEARSADPARLDALADAGIAQVRGHPLFGRIMSSVPDHLDPERMRTVIAEMTAVLREDYADAIDKHFDEDGVFDNYYKDAIRDSIESFDGVPLREKPLNFDGRMALENGRPSLDIRVAGLREQLLEAVPDPNVRGFISMAACQAGLEALLTIQISGPDPRQQTTMWEGAPTLVDLLGGNARTTSLNYAFADHRYSISFDPIVPGSLPDDPVNLGRRVHLSLNITQSLSSQGGVLASKTIPLMGYRVELDMPLSQPNLRPGEVPEFTLRRIEGTKLC
ncbi:MAG: hypothetical protein SOX97_06980 [Sutterella sp.]|nr:hypothetical protein [Sutterella sp.]